MGADLHKLTKYHLTPLFLAIYCDQINMVKILLEAGASRELNQDNFYGETPLIAVLTRHGQLASVYSPDETHSGNYDFKYDGCYENRLGIMKLLLDAGTNVNRKNTKGDLPLALSLKDMIENRFRNLDSEIIKTLIAAGAEVNDGDSGSSQSLLMVVKHIQCNDASMRDYDESLTIIKDLIAAGANAYSAPYGEESPYSDAMKKLAHAKAEESDDIVQRIQTVIHVLMGD